ncbi:hypothetical protein [Methylobacterium radiodurans]|uniref:Uncharacterized protein n=1 Tax=Methylobacterium radiodurans TaxID=2202828 RepID=A0A2U8VPV0_9HYPH|nr:hypothetical protein [Methylobacterium radiodurans]AWN35643.1 hypothetical protein DK427_07725 [Methylobacterium radiodurans]
MEPHRFEQDGEAYEARFERVDGGWVAHIRRIADDAVRSLAFPDGVGYAADDVRGSLVAGCEAAAMRFAERVPTRH